MALGTRAFAAIGAAAVAASALIAFLLLGGGAGDGGAAARREGESRVGPAVPAAATPTTRSAPAALAPDDSPPPDPSPVAEGPSVDVRVLLGGVQPVPGSPVLGVERDADGQLLACFGDDGPTSGETDAEGRFVLRWPAEPKERLITVFLDRGAGVDRVEGAAEVGTLSGGQTVLLAIAPSVTVLVSDDGGPPRIRIVDDATGAVLPADSDPVIEYAFPGTRLPKHVEREPLRAEAGGWWSMRRVSPDAIEFRVRAAGYRDALLDGWNGAGRQTVRLAASGTGVRGVLEAPPDAKEPPDVWVHRVDRPEEDERPPLGRVRPGPFLLDALEDGDWEIEVKWGNFTSVVRRFRYDGGLLDLGPLRVLPGSTLRVRWAASAPVGPRTPLVLQRVAARGGSRSTLSTTANDRGEFVFLALIPGEVYELSSRDVPGWRERVTAPVEPDAEGEFDAGKDLRFARCRLTFTVEGKKPSERVVLLWTDERLAVDAGEDTVELRLVPGRQEVRALLESALTGGDSRSLGGVLSAAFDVPDVAEFEATVDLKPRK